MVENRTMTVGLWTICAMLLMFQGKISLDKDAKNLAVCIRVAQTGNINASKRNSHVLHPARAYVLSSSLVHVASSLYAISSSALTAPTAVVSRSGRRNDEVISYQFLVNFSALDWLSQGIMEDLTQSGSQHQHLQRKVERNSIVHL